jgi:small-conductance mechanosensitive channel
VRATTIRTYDGRRVVIPNAELFTNAVTVNTAFEKRRLQYDLGIGYGDDIGQARQLILEAMRGVDGVLSDPAPDALVVGLADSTVNIRARWWIQPPRRADALDNQYTPRCNCCFPLFTGPRPFLGPVLHACVGEGDSQWSLLTCALLHLRSGTNKLVYEVVWQE